MNRSKVISFLGELHVFYLALLPAAASLFLFSTLQPSDGMAWLIFILGTGIVAMYLLFAVSKVPRPKSLGGALLQLLDAPLLIATTVFVGATLPELLLELVLVELLAMLLPFLVLAARQPASLGKRIGGLTFIGVLFGGVLWLLIHLLSQFGHTDTFYLVWIFGAVLISAVTNHHGKIYAAEERNSTRIIALGTMAWVLAFFLGGAFLV